MLKNDNYPKSKYKSDNNLVIISDRLYLKPSRHNDADVMTQMLIDPEVSRQIALFKQPYEHQHSLDWCKMSESDPDARNGLFLSIFLKQSAKQIGCMALTFDHSSKETDATPKDFLLKAGPGFEAANILPKSGEVGCWIGRDYWKKGYASEALDGVLDLAFNCYALEVVHSSTAVANVKSQGLLYKGGFACDPETFMRDTECGERRPSYNFKITADEWRRMNADKIRKPSVPQVVCGALKKISSLSL